MPGLLPGIQVLEPDKDLDGRDKPGHDELVFALRHLACRCAVWFTPARDFTAAKKSHKGLGRVSCG